MSDYSTLLTADRRLVILRLLGESGGYTANEYLIQAALDGFGHNIGRDLLHTELAWLAEQGLLSVAEVGGVQVATLSARGSDVAEGRALVPGVKRPEPG
jgi:hypothetical protein